MNASLAIPSLPLLARARAVGAAAPAAPSDEPAHLIFSVGGMPYACSISGLEKLLRVADVKVSPAPKMISALVGLRVVRRQFTAARLPRTPRRGEARRRKVTKAHSPRK